MAVETTPPFLIIGLGNPGRKYRGNRHNVGFLCLDRLAARLGTSFSRLEFQALATKTEHQEKSLLLAKPQTYMNLSGKPVGALLRYYRVPLERLMVIYDDVDLPLGVIRIRPSGGSAGHKGMASIIERLNSQEFPRLRLGIERPPGRKEAADYVLKDFSAAELEVLNPTLDRAVEAVLTFVGQGLEAAMNKFNGSI